MPRWCDLDWCDHLSCSLPADLAVVSRVARADENSLRHVERHAIDDLQAMRLWNRRPTAALFGHASHESVCQSIFTRSLLEAQRALGKAAVAVRKPAIQSDHSEQLDIGMDSLLKFNAPCRREANMTAELRVRTKKSELSTQCTRHAANFHAGHHLNFTRFSCHARILTNNLSYLTSSFLDTSYILHPTT